MKTKEFESTRDAFVWNDTLISHNSDSQSIFEAMRSGNVSQVKELLENFGSTLLEEKDEYGHSPVHWMALHGHTQIARLLISKCLNVHHSSKNSQGPKPIHWASRNGHVAIVDILLSSTDVEVDSRDHKGLTPLMMSCMFGRSYMVAYLLGRGANPCITDMNGDTALHWAAYKGFPIVMKMLMNSNFELCRPDNFGSSPLHLACISGNLFAVQLLCSRSSLDLEPRDRNRKTPSDLAFKHQHEPILKFLDSEKRRRNNCLPVFLDIWTLVFGHSGRTKGPIYFFLGSVLLWAYPMYFLRSVTLTWNDLRQTHYVFLFFNTLMWISLVISNRKDPGYLKRNTDEYHKLIKQIASYDEVKASKGFSEFLLLRLCHCCQVVKSLRTKHCKICERCVTGYDHHCPYIYNCVGSSNKSWFLVFTLTVAINCSLIIFFAIYSLVLDETWELLTILGLIEAFIFCGLGWFLSGFTLLYATMNLSSIEVWKTKKSFIDGDGIQDPSEIIHKSEFTEEFEHLIDYSGH